ncbi:hypothetical protein DFH06DRAFT_1330562 [Mycena polygramma]|nr:hypothetical protein DFH06DRAFT_1330562 [Mycena polygramma]
MDCSWPDCEVLIAITMTYLLLKVEVSPSTHDIAKDTVQLAFKRIHFPPLSRLSDSPYILPSRWDPYFATPVFMLPGIHANTLLATLNNRAVIKRLDAQRKAEFSDISAMRAMTRATTFQHAQY